MTSSEISQIKKLESVKYHDISSKNDLGTDLHVPLMLTDIRYHQNPSPILIWPNIKINQS